MRGGAGDGRGRGGEEQVMGGAGKGGAGGSRVHYGGIANAHIATGRLLTARDSKVQVPQHCRHLEP